MLMLSKSWARGEGAGLVWTGPDYTGPKDPLFATPFTKLQLNMEAC